MAPLDTLVCRALPFGFGPAAKLLALARALRPDWRLVFVGEGVAHELVARSPGAFDEVVEAAPTDPRARAAVEGAWGVLSAMDRDAAGLAAAAGRPLFVLDSLLWMRDEVPEAWRRARILWSQSFGEGSAGPKDLRATEVGPVLGEPPPAAGRRRGLVVHLGGCAGPGDRRELYEAYVAFVLDAVRDTGLARRFDGVTLLAGDAAARAGAVPDGVRLAASSVEEASAILRGAEAVLTAPGLTATLTCFRDGTPTWFLPPQNYSQWCALRRLRAAGAAEGAFHWEDLRGAPVLAERIPAREYEPVVREAVTGASRSPGARQGVSAALARVGEEGHARVEAQSAFFRRLGRSGLDRIASDLRRSRAAPGEPDDAVVISSLGEPSCRP